MPLPSIGSESAETRRESGIDPKLFDAVLPSLIDGLNTERVCEVLDVGERQLRKDAELMRHLKPPGWDYTPNSGWYSHSSIRVLWTFRQLVVQRRRREAIKAICKIMEGYWDGCQGKTTPE